MGLIYDPSESNELIATLELNINSSKVIFENLKAASEKVIYSLSGKTLTGDAYAAAKELFRQLIRPSIVSSLDILHDIEHDLARYRAANDDVGQKYLSEDELNERLAYLRAQEKELWRQIYDFKTLRMKHHANNNWRLGDMYEGRARDCKHYLDIIADECREIEEDLKKLHRFNTISGWLFSNNLDKLATSLIGGTALIKNPVMDETGQFSFTDTIKFLKSDGKHIYKVFKRMDKIDKWEKFVQENGQSRVWRDTDGRFGYGARLLTTETGELTPEGKTIKRVWGYNFAQYGKFTTALTDEFKGKFDYSNLKPSKFKDLSTLEKVGAGFQVVGLVSTVINAGEMFGSYQEQGYTVGQSAALTARKTVVNVTFSTVGGVIGTFVGAVNGLFIAGPEGVLLGAFAGNVIGSQAGSWTGSAINDELDKYVPSPEEMKGVRYA